MLKTSCASPKAVVELIQDNVITNKEGTVMKNFEALNEAVNFMEQNLCEPVSCDRIADHCHISLSSLQKLFRYALHMSVKEYISKRRMTCAAYDLLHTNLTITEIAMKYQYNSSEVFTRAFQKMWNQSPSIFRKTCRFTELFPKIQYQYQKGDDVTMSKKRVDLSDAYDLFRSLEGTYVLCFDIVGLSAINAASRRAGDMAILETTNRIESASGDQMVLLRIGGDEFALLTALQSQLEAQKVAERIMDQNGIPIACKGMNYPLSLHVGYTKIPDSALRCSEFFEEMHQAILESKNPKI